MKKQVIAFLMTILTAVSSLTTAFALEDETAGAVDIIVQSDNTQPTQPTTETTEPTQAETASFTGPAIPTEPETTPTYPKGEISLNRGALTLGVGESYGLVAKIAEGDTSQTISWSVSDNSVASVDDKGKVTALSFGVADVTAKLANGSEATCTITVKNAPTSVRFNRSTLTLGVGESYGMLMVLPEDCHAWYFTFTSSNKKVATIERRTGKIKAVGTGTTTLTLKTYNGMTATCKLTVKKAPTSVKFNRTTLTLGAGESYGMKQSSPSGCYAWYYTFSSSNPSVATIDRRNGKVTALSAGVTTLTVRTYNGKVGYCTLTVKNAPRSVKLNTTRVNMDIGSTYTLKQSSPKDCYAWYFYFTSDNPSVVTVEKRTGKLKAVSSGIANITVYTYNGKTASCTVDVSVVDRTAFYTSSRVESDIKKLSNKYPGLIEVSSIGKSTRGKNIPLVKLGNGSKKGSIVAGIHGRENITINFTLLSIEDYCRAYYSSSGTYGSYNMRSLLNEYTLYIVPMCNPDGTDICNNGELPIGQSSADRYYYRGNANNVNLNANFPFYWKGVTDSGRQKGSSAASEIETKNLMKFCKSYDFEWLLDMHIVGNCLYWRDSANGTVPGDYAMASALRDKCGYYLCPTTTDVNGYGGGFENWFRNETGNPGICVELVKTDSTTQYMNLYDYNRNFNTALNWNKTKYTFAVAMSCE